MPWLPVENEMNDLVKNIERIYFATQFDLVQDFATKLHTLCNTLTYMTEHICHM